MSQVCGWGGAGCPRDPQEGHLAYSMGLPEGINERFLGEMALVPDRITEMVNVMECPDGSSGKQCGYSTDKESTGEKETTEETKLG